MEVLLTLQAVGPAPVDRLPFKNDPIVWASRIQSVRLELFLWDVFTREGRDQFPLMGDERRKRAVHVHQVECILPLVKRVRF